MSKLELDEVDRGIINILQNDARTPYTEVAKQLKVSDATIHVRVRKLEDAEIIKKYTIVVNPEKVGKPQAAHILVNINPGKMQEVTKRLIQIEDIYEIHEIHGRYDLLLKLHTESIPKLRDIITEIIRKIPGILSTEVLTGFKTWKDT